MTLGEVKDPSISKELYNFSFEVKNKIESSKWVEYINNHSEYYVWIEDTEEGKNKLLNIDKIPKNFKNKILSQLDKKKGLCRI